MSDASFVVTYTSVYTNSEPWRYYREDSAEVVSPRVIVYRYDGLFIQPVALPYLNYMPGPKHPPSPDYVPGPEHPLSPVYDDGEEEEEHLALADSSPVPIVDPVPLAEACLTTSVPGFEVGKSSVAGAARQPGPALESDRRDRPDNRRTAMILDREAMYARETWTGFENRSAAIEAHVRTLEVQVATLISQTSSLQTQLTTTIG
nr:hypothetical protein [Tanacetum cinerariifolium]